MSRDFRIITDIVALRPNDVLVTCTRTRTRTLAVTGMGAG